MGLGRCLPEEAQETDRVLSVLSAHVRREIVRFCENDKNSGEIEFENLLEYLDERAATVSKSDLAVELDHVHLPKLESEGWLESDHRTRDIRYYGHDSAGEHLSKVSAIFAD